MAFGNFIKPGTYSNIQKIQYCKQNKFLFFNVVVYSSDAKVEEITTVSYLLDGQKTYPTIKDKDLTDPPTDPSEGDAYIIPENATGAWAGHTGQIARYISDNWSIYDYEEVLYVEDEDKYYRLSNGSPVEVTDTFTSALWDQYFGIDALSMQDSNLLAQIYIYLKTRQEFANVTDC